jgi:hypothetical protein
VTISAALWRIAAPEFKKKKKTFDWLLVLTFNPKTQQ